ncbi:MAG: response regulator [Aggregatilineales bacterium]
MSHILITDDNSAYRTSIIDVLELEHYTLTEAENGEQALAQISANPPDLILCDIDMPIIDGLEVLRRVKANPKTSHIPFIMITGRKDKATMTTAIELGANDYIQKPMEIAVLLEKIKQVLGT